MNQRLHDPSHVSLPTTVTRAGQTQDSGSAAYPSKKIELPGTIDFEQAKALAKSAAAAIQTGKFGYAIIVATRPKE